MQDFDQMNVRGASENSCSYSFRLSRGTDQEDSGEGVNEQWVDEVFFKVSRLNVFLKKKNSRFYMIDDPHFPTVKQLNCVFYYER